MSFKQAIENHIGLFFLGTLAIGFASGWGAFSAIQLASGHTSISVDRLKQLESSDAQDKRKLLARQEELEIEQAKLQQRLAINRPITGNYVRNIILSPPSPAILKVGTRIEVKFDYVLTKGEIAHIWVMADNASYEGASPVTGSGTSQRGINLNAPGKLSEITFHMASSDGTTLYEMKIPVEYLFK